MSEESPLTPEPTPSDYTRTTGGHLQWNAPTVEHLQRLFPGYEVLEVLGIGGMGAVYKARQLSLDRLVAIKMLPPEVDDDERSFALRFQNEARTMARMNHPGIVQVYDFGQTSEGQLFIVMEFIDGTDIAHMIDSQGRLPAEYALAITAHVCDALQYAHDHHVIHRDIKPANILINTEGVVKVADFGLAKANDSFQSDDTDAEMTMGTPDFVAPEALTLGVELDRRADLYSVGVMLFVMLTGQVPRGHFRLPSTTLGTDPRFDSIIARAMEMDREARYQAAREIRRDLDAILTTPNAKAGGPHHAAIPKHHVQRKHAARAPHLGYHRPPDHPPSVPSRRKPKGTFVTVVLFTAIAFGTYALIKRGNTVASQRTATATSATEVPLPPFANTGTGQKHLTATGIPGGATSVPPAAAQEKNPSAGSPQSDPRLARLAAGFQSRFHSDAQKPFEAALTALNQSYVNNGLGRAKEIAQQKGDVKEVSALDAEKARVLANEPLPPTDLESLPPSLKSLRGTYRSALAKLEAERARNGAPLYDLYLKALDVYMAELMNAHKITEAQNVQKVRQDIAAEKDALTGEGSPTPSARVSGGTPGKIAGTASFD